MYTCLERITDEVYIFDIYHYSNYTNQSLLLDIYGTILVLFYFDKNEKFDFPNETRKPGSKWDRKCHVWGPGLGRSAPHGDVTIFSTFPAESDDDGNSPLFVVRRQGTNGRRGEGVRGAGLLRRGSVKREIEREKYYQ